MLSRLMILFLWGLPGLAVAQEVAPDAGAKAEDILRQVDGRLYYPCREGLDDIQFMWRMSGTGAMAQAVEGVYVAYAWKKPDRWALRFVDEKGSQLEKLSPFFDTEEGKEALNQVITMVQAMAQQLLIGRPLSEVYEDYFKDVRERQVNNKIEYRLILTPKSKKLYSKVVIKVVDGLPIEFIKTNEQGHELRYTYRYEPRDEKYVCMGFRVELANRVMLEENYSYERRKGIYVVTNFVRLSNSGPLKKQDVRLENLAVNRGIDDSWFGEKQ